MAQTQPRPAPLVPAAHGTQAAAGQEALQRVRDTVAHRLPEVDVRLGYVDVLEPTVTAALAAVACRTGTADRPDPVVVPYLLTAGYHVQVDLPAAVTEVGAGQVAAPLAPSPGVDEALLARLAEVGVVPAEPGVAAGPVHVLLVGAGSTRPGVAEVLAGTAQRLGDRIGVPVTAAALTGDRPLADRVAELRARGVERVVVAAALLLPGHFHDRLAQVGADAVTAPLNAHPRVVDELIQRWREAADG